MDVLAGGVTIPYTERGSGPPIVVLHDEIGFPADAPFLTALARHGRVVVPVHPGFGAAPLPDWIDSVDDLAYVYLDLLEALDLRDVTLIGCSIGGWIAAEMAVKSTARVARLVLAGALGIKIGDRLTRDVADIFASDPAELQRLLWHDPAKHAFDPAAYSDAELEIVARNREASALYLWEPYAHDPKLTRRLHRIDVPALLLWGESDGIVAPAYGRAYAERIPNARFETIAAAGHMPHVEAPDAFAERVARFLGAGDAQ